MKKTLPSLIASLLFLAIAIAVFLNQNSSPEAKPKRVLNSTPKPVFTSGKLEIGDVTISYKYLHKHDEKHVDTSFTFATSKPAKIVLRYGKGFDGKNNIDVKNHVRHKKEHVISVHEIEPATNFHYQLFAITQNGEKAQTEIRGFLTPPLKKSEPKGNILTDTVKKAKEYIQDFLTGS